MRFGIRHVSLEHTARSGDRTNALTNGRLAHEIRPSVCTDPSIRVRPCLSGLTVCATTVCGFPFQQKLPKIFFPFVQVPRHVKLIFRKLEKLQIRGAIVLDTNLCKLHFV